MAHVVDDAIIDGVHVSKAATRSMLKDGVRFKVASVADVVAGDYSAYWGIEIGAVPYDRVNGSIAAHDGVQTLVDAQGTRFIRAATTLYAGLNPRGAYSAITTYAKNDSVSLAGTSYVSRIDANLNHSPDSSPTQWQVLSVGTPGDDGDPGSSNVVGTSTTSRLIGTGSKAFTVVETARGWGVGARLRVSSNANPANFMEGAVASYSGTALTITSDLVGGSGTLADWTINLAGQPGATGAAGSNGSNGSNGTNGADGTDPGVLLTWDTGTTDADPGTGEIRANNASLASATVLYISKTSRAGSNIAAFLAALDDSTNTVKGVLTLTKTSDDTQATFNSAAVTDATGYVKLAVSGHSGATSFTAADAISFQFSRAGDAGGGSGSVTSVGVTVPTGLSVSGSPVTTSGVIAITYTAGYQGYLATEASKLSGIAASADVTSATNVGSSIHGATGKTTPVDADTIPLIDSAASNVLKKVTWANVKATLKTYLDTLYQPIHAMLTSISALTAPGADRIAFWDHSALAWTWLTLGTNLSITGTTIDAAGGGGTAATQSDQETATSTTTFVSPGRQHFHPSAAKAWGTRSSAASPSLTSNYGFASVSDGGAGITGFTLSTAQSSATYPVVAMAEGSASTTITGVHLDAGSKTTTFFYLETILEGSSEVDVVVSVAVFGDH
jgi:hypothetical protein